MINPFKVEIPDNLKSRKSRASYWILYQVYVMDLGRGQVLGKFTQLFTEAGLLILVLDKVGMIHLSLTQLIMLLVIGFVCVWLIGFLYQHLGLDKIGQLVSTRRNPMLKYVYDNTVEVKGYDKG